MNELYLDPMDQATQQFAGPDMSTMYTQGRPQVNFNDPNQVPPSLDLERGYRPQLTSQRKLVDENGIVDLEALKAQRDAVKEEVSPGGVVNLELLKERKEQEEAKEKGKPSFLKKLDMINTGVHRGVTHFTYKLMSMVAGEKGKEAIKRADKKLQEEFEGNIEKYGAGYSKAGEVAGEVLATLPAGAGFGAVAKGASLASKAAPYGLKTIAKYGTSAVGGAGLFAGLESQRYDPENPDQLINQEAAEKALSSPLSYAMPMLGTKLGTWMERSRQLQEARKVMPNILPRDVLEKGPTRKLSHQFFDSLPALTGTGKRIQQLESIGDDVHNLIRKISGGNDAITSKDLFKFSANKLQMGLKRLERGQAELWNKPFLKQKIANKLDLQDVGVDAINLVDEIKSSIPLAARAKTQIEKILSKKDLQIDDLKNFQTVLGNMTSAVRKANAGGIGRELASDIGALRDKVMRIAESNLSKGDLKDFLAAKAYSANLFKMKESMPQIKKALTDEIAAKQIIKNIIGDSPKYPREKITGILSPRGQKAVQAAKIAEALESSIVDNRVNIDSFLKKTSEFTSVPEVLGSANYKMLEGINKYLSSINEAANVGWWRQATLAAGAGSQAVYGQGPSSVVAGAALITAPATVWIANHPYLKQAFGALTKKLSSSAYQHLTNKIEQTLVRAGFYMGQDNTITHKDEEAEE